MESVWIARRQLREKRKREREEALRLKTAREDEARRAKGRRDGEVAPRVRDDVLDPRKRAMMRLRRATGGGSLSTSGRGK